MDWSRTVVTVNPNTAVDCVFEVPDFEVGKHTKGRLLSRSPAGKGINVARALARLGRNSVATGFVGLAELESFDQHLQSAGPGRAISQLLAVHGQTRQNITLVDPQRHTDTHIRDRGFQVTPQDIQRIASKVSLLCRPQAMVLFTGSLPLGMELSDLRGMVATALTAGAKVALDADVDALRTLLRTGDPPLPRLWLLKPNRQELAGAAGLGELADESDVLRAARALLPRVAHVCVTLGDQGAILVNEQGAWQARLQVDQAHVTNTVGCGDCAMAGLLDAHLRGGSPDLMLRRGVAAGAANALTPGIAEFSSVLVDEIAESVQVQPLD